MSKSDKAFYGGFSFLPLVLVVGFLISIMGPLQALMENAAWNSAHPRKILPYLPDLFSSVFVLVILMAITAIVLLIIFIMHASKNRLLSKGERTIWIILFFVAGILAFPLYFLMRIWNVKADTEVKPY